MVSKVHGLTTMVSKMQKLCIWAEMYQNDGLRAIYPDELPSDGSSIDMFNNDVGKESAQNS